MPSNWSPEPDSPSFVCPPQPVTSGEHDHDWVRWQHGHCDLGYEDIILCTWSPAPALVVNHVTSRRQSRIFVSGKGSFGRFGMGHSPRQPDIYRPCSGKKRASLSEALLWRSAGGRGGNQLRGGCRDVRYDRPVHGARHRGGAATGEEHHRCCHRKRRKAGGCHRAGVSASSTCGRCGWWAIARR